MGCEAGARQWGGGGGGGKGDGAQNSEEVHVIARFISAESFEYNKVNWYHISKYFEFYSKAFWFSQRLSALYPLSEGAWQRKLPVCCVGRKWHRRHL